MTGDSQYCSGATPTSPRNGPCQSSARLALHVATAALPTTVLTLGLTARGCLPAASRHVLIPPPPAPSLPIRSVRLSVR